MCAFAGTPVRYHKRDPLEASCRFAMATHQDQSREDEVEKIDSHIIIDLCTPPPDHESTPILMAIPEEDVLKPKDASLRNSDEWPTFNLQKISVTSQKTGEVCSLLAAHKANPVIVLGKLEKVDSDLLPLSMMNLI